jgi:predicted chitinase
MAERDRALARQQGTGLQPKTLTTIVMDPIQLLDAARYYNHLPHQSDAWNWLQTQLSQEQIAGFAERYRAAPPEPEAPRLITAEQCEAIFLRPITAEQLADLNSCLDRFSIHTPARMRHFLAQIGHESGGLRWLKELADGTAYEGRRDLGNTRPGDGPRFKGAGAIQLTGRANYEDFATFIGDLGVMEGCDYVSVRYPFTSAGFWWHSNRINSLVDAGASCRAISARVNGRDPANGLADREAYFERALQAIPDQTSPAEVPTPAAPTEGAAPAVQRINPLQVPYFSQRDSSTAQAHRMCFSSSCAMLVATLLPDALSGEAADDRYLACVQEFGDTTDAQAQVQAMETFGIKARLVQNADFSTIEQQIDRGIPVPCGFIHKGGVEAPYGGGHWLCVIGYTPTAVIVNDPYGDLDLIGGTYLSADGRGLTYSRRNFGRRWMVEPAGDSYAFAPGKGWAILAEPPALETPPTLA